MTISFDKVAGRVFQILKSRGYSLKMYQNNGQRAFDPSLEARKFFVEDEGIMVAINESGENSEIKVYISDDTELDNIEALLISLRQTANFFGLLYNVRKYGKRLKPKEFAFLAYKTQREEEEEMTESVKVPKEITRTIDALLLRKLTPNQIREELTKFEFAGVRGPLKFVIDEYIQEGYRNFAEEKKGEYYADKEDGIWYVFHSETGKGHASYMDKHSAEKEAKDMNLSEAKDTSSLWGSSHSSYQRVGSKQARLVVRHSQPVDEDKFAARSRHINKIFIENADGERIRFPTNYLQGARAMTRHVSMGGNFNDAIGEHIQHISEEYAVLRKFKTHAGRKLGEQAKNVIDLIRNRGKEITAEVKGMQGPTSYKRYVENFEPKQQTLEEDIVMLEAERIRKIFDSATPYDGIDEAYIAVARLSRMNEDFDNIAEMLESGNISFSPKRDVRSGAHTNRNSAMLNKLYDLAERATDHKVSGFISRIAEKITNNIPMERAELNLVKGIVGIAEGTAIPVVEALDEFVDWTDSYLLEVSPELTKPLRSEEEARADIAAKKKKDADAQSRWKKNQKTDEGSPKLDRPPHSPRRSEEEAERDIEANKKKYGKKDTDSEGEYEHFWNKVGWPKDKEVGEDSSLTGREIVAGKPREFEDEVEEAKPHWKKGRNRFNKQTKSVKYRKDETHTEDPVNRMSTMPGEDWDRYLNTAIEMHDEGNSVGDIGSYLSMDPEHVKEMLRYAGIEPREEEFESRSTDSIIEEFEAMKTKNSLYRKLEKELHDRNISETTDNIIRFQELAGIQKKR